jgi:hypothetical protein
MLFRLLEMMWRMRENILSHAVSLTGQAKYRRKTFAKRPRGVLGMSSNCLQ